MEKRYSLVITPAIPPGDRHQIEDVLKKAGYHVTGGGSYVDGSECDISFYEEGGELDEKQTK